MHTNFAQSCQKEQRHTILGSFRQNSTSSIFDYPGCFDEERSVSCILYAWVPAVCVPALNGRPHEANS